MNKPTAPPPSLAELSDDEFSRQMSRALQALPDVPPALQRAALALFPAPTAAATVQGLAQAVLKQISAVLSFDSWAAPALVGGMRSLRAPTRHLLFSAQGRDIDLRISPQGAQHTSFAEAFALAGQVLGPDESGRVELRREGDAAELARSAELDALGEFRIDGLARGLYLLSLQMGGEQIVLPPLVVGEPAGEPAR